MAEGCPAGLGGGRLAALQRCARRLGQRASVALHRLRKDDSGAIMVMGLFMATILVASLYYVIGIGEAIAHREDMQDGADVAALGGAITIARGMNFIVLINLLMMALVMLILILKLIVTLLGIISIVLACIFMYPLSATVAGWAVNVNNIAKKVEKVVFPILKVCHYTQKVVKYITPAGAELAVVMEAKNHGPGPVKAAIIVPERWTLPVEAGKYSELCKKAGEEMLGFVMGLIPGVPNKVKNKAKRVAGKITQALSKWFCGDGDTPAMQGPGPKTEIEWDRTHPSTAQSRKCEDDLMSGNVGLGSAPSELNDVHNPQGFASGSSCDDSQQERIRSRPSMPHGKCEDDCVPREFNEMKASARVACNPNTKRYENGGKAKDFMYTRSENVDHYRWNKAEMKFEFVMTEKVSINLYGQRPIINGSTANDRKELGNPCGKLPWNSTSPSGPVCSEDGSKGIPEVNPEDWENLPPLQPDAGEDEEDPRTWPDGKIVQGDRYAAIDDVFMCSREMKTEKQMDLSALKEGALGDGNGPGSGNNDNKAPHLVDKGLEQGDEDFQVRSLAFGSGGAGAWVDRVIRIAGWGRSFEFDERILAGMERVGLDRLALAQAEFFFEPVDGDKAAKSVDKESWNWEMGWRARLVPFSLPSFGKKGKPQGGGGEQASTSPASGARVKRLHTNSRGGTPASNNTSASRSSGNSSGARSAANKDGSSDGPVSGGREAALQTGTVLDDIGQSTVRDLGGRAKGAAANAAGDALDHLANKAQEEATGWAKDKANELLPGSWDASGALARNRPGAEELIKMAKDFLPEPYNAIPPEAPEDFCLFVPGEPGEDCAQFFSTVEQIAELIEH